MSLEAFDVVIVGAGPAGLSTWLHLHDRDPKLAARCVVIDAATHPREKICGGGLTWPGDRQLEFLDLQVDVPSVAIHEVSFRFGSVSFLLPGDHAMRVVRRREFDHALARRAAERGMELREDVKLVGIEEIEGGVMLHTTRGTYRARVVVGADGVQSVVRSRAGFGSGAGISRLLKVVTDRSELERDPHRAVFDFSRLADGLQGYVWHFPCLEHGLPAMDRGIFDSRVIASRPRADLRRIFSDELGKAGFAPDAGAWLSHPVRPYSPDTPLARPHAILVGDAAGIDPILGEGISQSLRHGDIAADVLVASFERDDFSMACHSEIFASHELGRSLLLRHQLAQDLYRFGPAAIEEASRLFMGWVGAGLP